MGAVGKYYTYSSALLSKTRAFSQTLDATMVVRSITNHQRNPLSKQKKKKKNKEEETKKKMDIKQETEEERMTRSCMLLRFEELPDYMKENEFVLGHYRAEWPLRRAVLSLFSWHNETINVWTHLIGFLVFLGLTMVHLRDLPQVVDLLGHLSRSISSVAIENSSLNEGVFYNVEASLLKLNSIETLSKSTTTTPPPPTAAFATARWPFFIFLSGSMFCLLTSSLCHLLSCHSHRLNLLLARLDYAGIAIMIVASFFPPMYYIFQCDPLWRLVYLSAITAFGVLTVSSLLSPHLTTGKFRSYRVLLFAAMGFSGIVPAVHAAVVNWGEPRRNVTLAWEATMAVMYVTGTGFYVSRVPERWRPGAFDIAGHSHQIFHVFVVAGALAHYGAALVFLDWRNSVGCA